MRFTLYSEVKSEMLYIGKRILTMEDEYANSQWTALRNQIIALAKDLRGIEAEKKAMAKKERRDEAKARKLEKLEAKAAIKRGEVPEEPSVQMDMFSEVT